MAFITEKGFRLYYEDTGGQRGFGQSPDVFNREIGAFPKAHRP